MTLAYSLSLSTRRFAQNLRFHASYLSDLGIGGGTWAVENPDELATKLVQAADFAFWHMTQYRSILENVR
jgi:hypothetical protein